MNWLEQLRKLSETLRQQGVTNFRQLYAWLRSVPVATRIIDYLHAHPGLQGIIYWIAALAVGLFAVGYAWLFAELSKVSQLLSVHFPWALLILSPIAFASAWWMVWRFAPGASGGGIPEVMVAIEVDPAKASIWAGTRVAVVKFFSSLTCALGGGAIGREGPTIQIAAAIFYSLGMPFRRIWPSLSHQSLLVAGGSAGIAAAFNTPLGGIVFAVEELSQQHFNRFKTFLISAVIISGLVAQWILGPYLFLGYPRLNPVSFMAIPWALAAGLLFGLAGAVFAKILLWTFQSVCRFTPRLHWKVSLLVGVAIAGVGWGLGPEVLGSGTDLVTRLLFEGGDVSWGVVLGRFFAPLISNVASVGGGIFAPAISAGAALGAKFAQITSSPFPNLMILLGMTSFLSGVTRAPFTAFVLVLEMTDRHSAIFPLMMASLVASLIAKLVDSRSFYERRCEAYLESLKIEESAGGATASTAPVDPRNRSAAPATSPSADPR